MKKRILLNESQCRSIEEIKRIIQSAHMVDIVIRKDGEETRYEADWLKQVISELKPNAKFEL